MMKKLLFLLAFFSIGLQAQNVNIPDANFKAVLLSSSSSNTIAKNLSGNYFAIDANGDGEISMMEALNVGELMIRAKLIDLGGGVYEPEMPDSEPILDYEGINYFKNATTINIDRSSPPTALLNISGLSNLRNLISVFPYEATLAINNCPALINLKYGGTQLTNTSVISQLKSLIVYDFLNSGNVDILSAIEGAPLLENLEFSTGMNVSFIEDSRFSLDLSNHQNIKSVAIKSIGLHSLNLSFCNQLSSLSLGAEYAPYYTRLFGKLDVSNCPSLVTLDLGSQLYNDNNFSNVDPNLVGIKANNCVNLTSIKFGSEFTGELEVNNCTALTSVELATNSGIQMSNVPSLKTISIDKYDGVSFDATPATNLEVLKLTYNVNTSHPYENYYGPLKNLTVKNNVSLKELSIGSHKISDVDVSGLQNLEKLHVSVGYNHNAQPLPDFSANFLHTLNAENCDVLNDVNIDFQAGLIDANFKNCTSLKQYKMRPAYYSNNGIIEKLNFENCTALESIDASRNKLTDLNIKNCTSLKSLNLENNQLTLLDVENLIDLEELYCGFNQLTTLNIESNPKLKSLDVAGNTQLTSLFIKNGADSFGEFGPAIPSENILRNTPNLKYICADENEIFYLKTDAGYMGLTDININTYCSFTPGGTFNTISGTAKFDANNNGCDATDNAFEFLKLKINDGISSGETFVQKDGKYEFYTQEGNFTLTAQAENPALFNVSPANFSTAFADANSNSFTQDICVTANGNQDDAEVVIAPLTGARPGFDATYKLVWRNKGNTTLSGKVILNFDSGKMTFVESSLPYSAISTGSIEFTYANLKPYANDAAEITFTINTPTNSDNPVNSGDILAFYSQITPSNGDLTPEDNHFAFNHTVVNSFDPNDIVCMEGETIPSVAVGKYMHYVVNFENTGTAEAENIVVKMDIDPAEFDISTLQLQNTSADVTTVVTGNQVEFFFKKIKLKSGGHGNVLLKIKSMTNLQEGDQVNNKASIYFDYNFPVETNDYVTTIQDQNSVLAAKINYTADNFAPGNYPINFDAGFSTGNVTAYVWEFSGNPSVSSATTVNPVITYPSAGNYSAKLTVYNAGGQSATQTITFKIGENLADLSTGKSSNGNLISVDSDDDDWKGYDINGVLIIPKTRHTFTGWGSADILNGSASRWITLNTSEGYFIYKSIVFTVPENAADARIKLRSLSFVRNWTYLVKVNPDGSEDETEITKTQFLGDGAKGWLNSRSPMVDLPLSPGRYYIKVLVYSNNPNVRQSLDVNAQVSCSAGLMYVNKKMMEVPTLNTADTRLEKIRIYPIPVQDDVSIVAADFITSVEVYDSSGRIVQKLLPNSKSKNTNININSPKGVYYLKIETTRETITRKIIKE